MSSAGVSGSAATAGTRQCVGRASPHRGLHSPRSSIRAGAGLWRGVGGGCSLLSELAGEMPEMSTVGRESLTWWACSWAGGGEGPLRLLLALQPWPYSPVKENSSLSPFIPFFFCN